MFLLLQLFSDAVADTGFFAPISEKLVHGMHSPGSVLGLKCVKGSLVKCASCHVKELGDFRAVTQRERGSAQHDGQRLLKSYKNGADTAAGA